MSQRLIDLATTPCMPWKNGGGETRELAIEPAGAALDAFEWRISSARVTAPGGFSSFPGIDRSLVLLDGAGLGLVAGDGPAFILAADSQPWRFAGEEPVHAEPLNGAVTDFNVMTRRDTWRHALQHVHLMSAQHLAQSADAVFIFCQDGVLNAVIGSGTPIRLGAGQSLLLQDEHRPVELHPAPEAQVYLVHLYRIT
ncbi:HutD family protein [Pseudomonas sp. GD03944]|uniref:HutD/Ves family protein n=1 Tax=Pseudomonas sp. GD03944 TaxID=2975409 RepID=UPI00244AC80A|nr:HutD family protein [Pseudomonas sp. GD03944]MDH1263125.1 HutD family protein [Pseudomonas sp. GD03944]